VNAHEGGNAREGKEVHDKTLGKERYKKTKRLQLESSPPRKPEIFHTITEVC
jgi:hypothetical protein